jgi:hypothetical protein
MDEGINTYTEIKVMDSIFGPRTSVINLAGATLGESEEQRLSYLGVADLDPITRSGWQYANSASYGGITYGKTGLVLLTLENMLGENTMQRAMQTYFMRYRFTHPTKDDFLKTIEEVSGKDLSWYFNQAIDGTEVLDYEVFKVRSYPVDWYQDKLPEKKGQTEYVSNVWIHRKNDFVFPVDLDVKFDNGETIRERWDGKDRWTRYAYQKKAQVASVEIDPEHRIEFDRNNFNNSYMVRAVKAPARKLVNYWTFCSQLLAQLLAWWMV